MNCQGQFSLISILNDAFGHALSWVNADTLAHSSNKHSIQFLESWESSKYSINKDADLEPAYEGLQVKDLLTNNHHELPLAREQYNKHSIDLVGDC